MATGEGRATGKPLLDVGRARKVHEAGDGRALALCTSQEGLELFVDDFVEKSLLGFLAFVLD
jgi:hypothetical protein